MSRLVAWTDNAWDDYLFFQQSDKKLMKRVNELIKAIKRDPFDGLGKPEPLKGNLSGYWSRRVNSEHRLVYSVSEQYLTIIQCRKHY